MRRRGFTLIELLVVVAIIASLVAILLPAFAGARRSSQRVVCLSNQRQLYLAIAYYAEEFNQQVPLGYSLGPGPGWKQYNYLLRSGSSSGEAAMRWMGLLYLHGAFDSPLAFYCPSERDELMSFDTESNPWPPDDTAPPGKSTRIGYGVRPLIGWPFPRELPMPEPLPRLDQIGLRGSVTILGDLIHKPDRITQRHGDGINVLRSDGAASWVALQQFEQVEVDGKRWQDTLDQSFDTGFNDVFLKEASNDEPAEGIWIELDRL